MEDDFDLSKLRKESGKKRKNSKVKGNSFERKIAKVFNERFGTTEFCRSPGSGAFATTHNLPEYLKIYGDIITPKGFKFIIEVKKGYNKEGISSIFNKNSILREMIAQATRDSEKCFKKFLLVISQDRKDIIVVTNSSDLYTGISCGADHIKVMMDNNPLYICKLNDLLKLPNSRFLE